MHAKILFYFALFGNHLTELTIEMTKYQTIPITGLWLGYHSPKPDLIKSVCLCCVQASESSNEEENLVYSMPPQTPLLEHDIDIQRSWTSCLPLPTPEEKMRLQAQSVTTDIIPINITGTSIVKSLNITCNNLKSFRAVALTILLLITYLFSKHIF